jgi:hypothetical protein
LKYLLPIILLICSCSKDADKQQKLSNEYVYTCNKDYKIVKVSQEYKHKVITIGIVTYESYTAATEDAIIRGIQSNQYLPYNKKYLTTESYSIDIFDEAMKKQGFSDDCETFKIKARLSDLEAVVYKKSK